MYRHGDRSPISVYAGDPNGKGVWPDGMGWLSKVCILTKQWHQFFRICVKYTCTCICKATYWLLCTLEWRRLDKLGYRITKNSKFLDSTIQRKIVLSLGYKSLHTKNSKNFLYVKVSVLQQNLKMKRHKLRYFEAHCDVILRPQCVASKSKFATVKPLNDINLKTH